jgi:hypothetical protein
MEEVLYNIEIAAEGRFYIIRIESDLGGFREYRASTMEGALEKLMSDLQTEADMFPSGGLET